MVYAVGSKNGETFSSSVLLSFFLFPNSLLPKPSIAASLVLGGGKGESGAVPLLGCVGACFQGLDIPEEPVLLLGHLSPTAFAIITLQCVCKAEQG